MAFACGDELDELLDILEKNPFMLAQFLGCQQSNDDDNNLDRFEALRIDTKEREKFRKGRKKDSTLVTYRLLSQSNVR